MHEPRELRGERTGPLSLADRKALLRERAKHNVQMATRLATISALGGILLLAQHLWRSGSMVQRGSELWTLFTWIYAGGILISLLIIGVTIRPWFGTRMQYQSGNIVGLILVLVLTFISILDSKIAGDISGLVTGIVVFAATIRSRRGYYVGVIVGATAIYVAGVMIAWGTVDVVSLVSAAIVSTFGAFIGISMESRRIETYVTRRELAYQNRILSQLSATDDLTGVLNRRTMTHRLRTHLDEYRRYATPYSVVLLDIDFFKRINDTHGHPVGDEVLVELARLLVSSLRTSDEIARYGGEEFVLILAHTRLAAAVEVSERIRASIATNPMTSREIPVSASFGVAEVFAEDTLSDSILKRADDALYRAKSEGRNRVASAEQPAPS